jgi:hypothetical protein
VSLFAYLWPYYLPGRRLCWRDDGPVNAKRFITRIQPEVIQRQPDRCTQGLKNPCIVDLPLGVLVYKTRDNAVWTAWAASPAENLEF